jgi:DNA-binding response OmpR family regulator
VPSKEHRNVRRHDVTDILVVEDDADIAKLVRIHLEDVGHRVTVEPNGRLALDRALGGGFDLLILDLMLPGLDGIELCRRLRAAETYTPVLMLTARSSETDRVLGLEIGADDYLTKPFSIRELQARVKAILRRVEQLAAADSDDQPIRMGGLEIDPRRREARLEGSLLGLTAREFELLHFFACHPGRVFTRTQLLDQVWGYAHEGYQHTVNTHINRIRRKLEPDPSHPFWIRTVWGVGYRFPAPEEVAC